MKAKSLLILLILCSLTGYLEWGGGNHVLLFQAEADILRKLFSDPKGVLHPFILLPLVGQILLMIALLRKGFSTRLIFIGVSGLTVLYLFILFVGILSANIKVIISTAPFILLSVILIMHLKSEKHRQEDKSKTLRNQI